MKIETFASFRIMGEHLDCNAVSSLFRLQPTEVHERGSPKLIRGKPCGSWSDGLWVLSTEGIVDSEQLDAHIEWLLAHLEPCRNQFDSLKSLGAQSLDVFCYWASIDGTPGGPTIPAGLLFRLGVLGIDLSLDFYSFAVSILSEDSYDQDA